MTTTNYKIDTGPRQRGRRLDIRSYDGLATVVALSLAGYSTIIRDLAGMPHVGPAGAAALVLLLLQIALGIVVMNREPERTWSYAVLAALPVAPAVPATIALVGALPGQLGALMPFIAVGAVVLWLTRLERNRRQECERGECAALRRYVVANERRVSRVF